MFSWMFGKKYALTIKNDDEGTVSDTIRAFGLIKALEKAKKIQSLMNDVEKEKTPDNPARWFIHEIKRLTE